jgi:hypothetical protein
VWAYGSASVSATVKGSALESVLGSGKAMAWEKVSGSEKLMAWESALVSVCQFRLAKWGLASGSALVSATVWDSELELAWATVKGSALDLVLGSGKAMALGKASG